MCVLCVSRSKLAAALRRAAEAARLHDAGFATWENLAAGHRTGTTAEGSPSLPEAAEFDAVYVLEPPPAGQSLAEAVSTWGQARKRVVVAGPVTAELSAYAALEGTLGANAPLGVSLAAHTQVGRAVLAAGQQRSAGEPVYLRYAAEEGSPDGLLWRLGDAISFASSVLGEPRSVYVTAVPEAGESGAAPLHPVHLSALVRHADDCISLIGIGAASDAANQDGRDAGQDASGEARLASTLYLGNRGAVEMNLVAGGVLLKGDGGAFGRLRDERHDSLTSWLGKAASLVKSELGNAGSAGSASEEHERARLTARRMVAVADAARRSLESGRAVTLSQAEGSKDGAYIGALPAHA